MEGYFRIAFTGSAGSGLGILVLRDGVVVGADIGGVSYDGTYTEDVATKDVIFNVTMSAPAGVTPVQTGVPLAAPASIPLAGAIKQDDLRDNRPTLVNGPLGAVNVIFTKIRDL
jgi:hypothetical protein